MSTPQAASITSFERTPLSRLRLFGPPSLCGHGVPAGCRSTALCCAPLGTDDRDFYLAAKRAGTNQAGRIYIVTYSAIDGSGNKATASATVAVPHDQQK
ncbi:MAG: hypothetical protein ACOY9D_05835 [Pseudomonadota bacterium]